MQKIKSVFITLFLFTCTLIAYAQNAKVTQAGKAVFTLTTFKADGSVLASSHGVFLSYDGTAAAPLKPFQGAAKAVVVDANGQTSNVEVITAFNELYDMCKFRIKGNAPAVCSIAKTPLAQGQQAWLIPYSIKKPDIAKATVRRIEKFNVSYNFYIFNVNTSMNTVGCPFVNDNGEVVGLLQPSATDDLEKHAAELGFLDTQKINGLSINDPSLEGCAVRVALPDDVNQAELTIMVAKTKYSGQTFKDYVSDFMKKFPQSATGYQEMARLSAEDGKLAEADDYMSRALRNVTSKAEVHSIYCDLIYRYLISGKDSTQTRWTFGKALSEAEAAYKLSSDPSYSHQRAQVLYAEGNYDKAYDIFIDLTKSKMRNPEFFYEAAQCKTMLKAPQKDIDALIDSCVTAFPKGTLTAPYYLIRGQIRQSRKQYRDALADYNVYDTLMLGRADHSFYYTRYQAEMEAHWWKQALNDISHALVLKPDEPTYYACLASLELMLNRSDEAEQAARRCVELAGDYADGYIILGMALIKKGKKADGVTYLQKAKQLGDSRAQALIDKYGV